MSDDPRSEAEKRLDEALAEARADADAASARGREAAERLAELEAERPRIDALRDLEHAFERLKAIGGECPVFGGPVDPERYDALLTGYRSEIAEFEHRLPELQRARVEAQDALRAANAQITGVEQKLEKERRKSRKAALEERRRRLREIAQELAESGAQPYRELLINWSGVSPDDRRQKRIAAFVLLLFLALSVLVPMLTVPERGIEDEAVPERLAQLMLEREPPPPPPEPEPVPVEEEVVEDEPPEEEPEVEPEREVAVAEPEPEPAPEEVVEARERAAQTGLLAMSSALQELADQSVDDQLGDQADITQEGQEATEVSRSIVTADAGAGTTGIETAALSRNVGDAGGSVGTRETGQVQSALAEGAAAQRREARQRDGQAGRTDEEIQIVFDRNKAALYRIYNRALRSDPTLEGKVILRLTIEPSGEVSAIEIVSSDLGSDEVEERVVQRVQLFDFGAKDVAPVTITYPIDFLPA